MVDSIRRGVVLTRRGDKDLQKSLREIESELDREGTGGGAVTNIISAGGGSGGSSGGGGSTLAPFADSAIQVYVYKSTDPTNPDVLIGSTTTDSAGYWELDCAPYCWTNKDDLSGPFQVTILRDGVVVRTKSLPDTFYPNAGGDGYLPIMVNDREIHV